MNNVNTALLDPPGLILRGDGTYIETVKELTLQFITKYKKTNFKTYFSLGTRLKFLGVLPFFPGLQNA